MQAPQRTTVCVLTPQGRGAISTVCVVGPRALANVEQCLSVRKEQALARRPLRSIVLAHWGEATGEEVVVSRLDEQMIEIHCHGGIVAARRIESDLAALGCAAIQWPEHLGERNESHVRREALADLSRATTERTALLLLDQYRGALEREVALIASALTAKDNAEHSHSSVDVASATARLQALLNRASLGLHLAVPWSVVLAGRPNVGKSSLINALLGYQRSLVFDQPGTTRDVLTATTACDGWPVQLSDTAGWREGSGTLESLGIAAAREAARGADLVLLVVDAAQGWTKEDQALSNASRDALVVWNKSDLPSHATVSRRAGLNVSALTGQGIVELAGVIAARLVPHVPPAGVGIPFTQRQVALLQAAQGALETGEMDAASAALTRFLEA